MVETKARPRWQPRARGVIEVSPEEIDDFELQVKRFRAGEWDPNQFIAFRVRQGIYGQRQPDTQMFRVKIPFGGLTADQLDALGQLAERYALLKKGHVTTRENIQFHHLKLEDTPDAMRLVGDVGLSTREAGGNTVRNVTGCPLAGVCADEPFDVTPYAAAYARYFVRHPLTQAMPRKIKAAFSGCERDCAITAIHDLGFLPRIQQKDGALQKGFKMVTGGGTSIMPRIAPTLYEFVPVSDYLRVTEAILRIFDRCDELRKNRMKARIKFFIDRIGIDEFRRLVEEELQGDWAQKSFDPTPLLLLDNEDRDAPTPPPSGNGVRSNGNRPAEFYHWVDTNVVPQRQEGYRVVYVKLPLGDIQVDQFPVLAEIARKYAGGRARTTAQQNLVFRWVREESLHDVWEELSAIGLGDPGVHEISDVTACPGTDSCKLGITSSMGVARALREAIQAMDIQDPLTKRMHIKISGCPNGCGQHHIADIGFHGAAAKGKGGQVPAYELFLGGSYENGGTRIGERIKVKLPAKRAPEALKRVLEFYQGQREDGETFKQFVERVGAQAFEPIIGEFRDVGPLNRENIGSYIDWDKTVIYKLERGEGECAV